MQDGTAFLYTRHKKRDVLIFFDEIGKHTKKC